MQTNHRVVETVYVDQRKPIMVPGWISLIVLVAVGVFSVVYLFQFL